MTISLNWNTLEFNKKFDLASFKSRVDKLDIGKLETTSIDLSGLSDVVKNEVVKKTVFDELVKKVNATQTTDSSNLVKKADYDTKLAETQKKIIDCDHDKYITTQEFNKLTVDKFCVGLKEAKLAASDDIADIVKNTDFDEKIKKLSSKS